jgi:DNA-binding cell septation regulator SpoVG
MSAPIQVIEVRRIEGHGNLRAFAKVRLGPVVIHGCRVIQQPGQRPWVALPQVPARKKADGTGSGWFPVIEITRRVLLDQVRDAVLEACSARKTSRRRGRLSAAGRPARRSRNGPSSGPSASATCTSRSSPTGSSQTRSRRSDG